MKLNPEDLKALSDDLAQVEKTHAPVLAAEPRIARPLKDAVEAAKMRVETVSEKTSSFGGNSSGLTNAGSRAS
jgi:hypothetical protein